MAKKTKAEPIECDYIAEQLRPLAVRCDSLTLDPANARKHPENNIEGIKGSLHVYGQRKPIVVNRSNGVVEAGNGTLAAARALGWEYIAAVFVDDDAATAAGFAISDNRTAELAEWDTAALDALLRDVSTGNDERLDAMLSQLAEDVGIVDIQPGPLPDLPSGDREPFRQMTFTLHDSQHKSVEQALAKAKISGGDSEVNANSNGNALATIAEAYLVG